MPTPTTLKLYTVPIQRSPALNGAAAAPTEHVEVAASHAAEAMLEARIVTGAWNAFAPTEITDLPARRTQLAGAGVAPELAHRLAAAQLGLVVGIDAQRAA